MATQASTFAVKAAQLNALKSSGGLLAGAKIALYTNPVQPSQANVLADFTLATFAGSTPQSVGTYSAPYTDTDGIIKISPPGNLFQPTDALLPQTIFGWVVTDSGGTVWLYASSLDTPVALTGPEDGLLVEAPYSFGE